MKFFKKIRKVVLIVLILVVSTLVFSKLTARADSLIGFNEGTGSAIHDTSGTASGTITNALWKTADECISGPCLYFDGTGDFVSFGDDANFDFAAATNWTIELWFKTIPISSGTRTLVAKYLSSTGTDGGYKLYMNSGGTVSFGVDDDNSWGPDDIVTSVSRYDDNTWHHITASKTGTSNISLYIDAIRVGQKNTLTATSTLANTDALYVGIDGDGSANGWSGYIDELKIVTASARTQDQVKTDYQKGITAHGTSASFSPGSSNLTNGLIGYWKMDESAGNSLDAGGNGFTLTNTGSTPFSTGKFGNAASLNGSSQYFFTANNSTLGTIGNLTISAWINTNTISGSFRNIVSKYDSGGASYGLYLYNQKIRLDLNGGSNYVQTQNDVITTTGTWYHIVAVYTKSPAVVKIYVNGVEQAVSINGTVPNSLQSTVSNFAIGAIFTLTSPLYFFNGTLDEVRVYNRALSSSDVSQLYNWAPDPVGWWKMDEGSGTTANDSSGYNNSTTAVSMGNPKWSSGKFGGAINLDGSTSITAPASTSLDFEGTQNFSFSVWVYPPLTGGGTYPSVFHKERYVGTSDRGGYALEIYNTGNVNFSIMNNDISNTSTTVSANQWVHFAGTYDGNYARIFKNGILMKTTANSTGVGTHPAALFEISGNGTRPFNGLVDELKIYNYARTQKQIVEDMNAGHPAGGSPISSKVLEWRLDEQQGATTHNSGFGSTLDGTLSGTAWSMPGSCKINGCAKITNTTDYIGATDPSFFDGIASMSATFWINPTALTADRAILTKSNTNQETFRITSGPSSSEMRVTVSNALNDTSNYFTTSGLGLSTGWQHIAMVYDYSQSAANRIRVYRNGTLSGGGVTGTIPYALMASTSNLRLGQSVGAVSALPAYYDDLKIYNYALTPAEVALDLNAGALTSFSVLGTHDNEGTGGDPPVGWWKFDDASGTSITDSSGNGRTGTWTGTLGNQWTTGKLGSAGNFDGATNEINTLNTLSDMPAFTYEAWFKPKVYMTGDVYQEIVTSGWTELRIYSDYAATDKVQIVTHNGIGYHQAQQTSTLPLNTWTHAVAVYDGINITLYINGVLEASTPMTGTANTGTTAAIGTWGADRYFNGAIDDVKIYNYARTPAQVAYDYNRGAPLNWYKFDECSGLIIRDTAPKADRNVAPNDGGIDIVAGGSQHAAGTCTDNDTGHAWSNGAVGKFGSSLSLDGNDDYAGIITPANIDTGLDSRGTISFWAKPAWASTTTTTTRPFFGDYNTGTADLFYLLFCGSDVNCAGSGLGTAGDLIFGALDAGVTQSRVTVSNSNFSWNANQWVHVTVVWDDTLSTGDMKIYINGKEPIHSHTNEGSLDLSSLILYGTTYIGNIRLSTAFYSGLLDDFRIYNYPLSSSQIQTVINEGASVRF